MRVLALFLAREAWLATLILVVFFILLSSPSCSYSSVDIGRVSVSSVIKVPEDYPTIREAIDAADPGDEILVSSGIYIEWNLCINKTLSLVGENDGTTVIDGGGASVNIVTISADNVSLSGFTIRNCLRSGIGLGSTGCTISGNVLMKCDSGIGLGRSSWSCIVNNVVSNNSNIGIFLYGSDCNTIKDNVIAFNYLWGMGFGNSCSNIVTGNTIKYTLSPFLTGAGFELDDNARDNIIYHNNFIHNSPVNAWDGGNNVWDNGYEGNYWSDYTGTDEDGDGIGDTPYINRVRDDCPLMNAYWNRADVNHDLKVDLYDAVLLCRAYGSTPGSYVWNPHCDIANPYEKIDLYDAVTLLLNYGKKIEISW